MCRGPLEDAKHPLDAFLVRLDWEDEDELGDIQRFVARCHNYKLSKYYETLSLAELDSMLTRRHARKVGEAVLVCAVGSAKHAVPAGRSVGFVPARPQGLGEHID